MNKYTPSLSEIEDTIEKSMKLNPQLYITDYLNRMDTSLGYGEWKRREEKRTNRDISINELLDIDI